MYGKSHLFNNFNKILSFLVVIKELNTKKRKIRFIRGLLLYVLEIIQDEKQVTVLKTNFQPLFWCRVQNVIKQNKKNSFLEFLFGFSNSISSSFNQEFRQFIEEIQTMKSEVNLLKNELKHYLK